MNNLKLLSTNFFTLDKLGSNINVPIRFSSKAKHVSIRINHKKVELVLPNKDFITGHRFLLEKESWIRKKLNNRTTKPKIDENTVPIFGKIYSLSYVNTNYYKVQINQDTICVHSLPMQHKDILMRFLKEKLRLEISRISNLLSKQYKLRFNEIKIMNNKTRWGTCSSKSVLSFNWRLIFTPREILEYVIIHEMCHLVEMNHSQCFWNLVARLCPDYKAYRSWLKENSIVLHQYLS